MFFIAYSLSCNLKCFPETEQIKKLPPLSDQGFFSLPIVIQYLELKYMSFDYLLISECVLFVLTIFRK